jgi:hypothetical protein
VRNETRHGATSAPENLLVGGLVFVALRRGHVEIARKLMAHGIKWHTTPAGRALETRDDWLGEMIKCGAITVAARTSNCALLAELLDYQARRRHSSHTLNRLVKLALDYSQHEALSTLISFIKQHDAQPQEWMRLDAVSQTQVYKHALRHNIVQIVRIFLENGANANEQFYDNGRNATPLIIVSIKGHLELAQLLIAHGALDRYSNDGTSALWWSRASGHKAVSDFLRRQPGAAVLYEETWKRGQDDIKCHS